MRKAFFLPKLFYNFVFYRTIPPLEVLIYFNVCYHYYDNYTIRTLLGRVVYAGMVSLSNYNPFKYRIHQNMNLSRILIASFLGISFASMAQEPIVEQNNDGKTSATPPVSHTSKYLRDPMPESWQMISESSMDLPTDDAWWHSFNDSMLDRLIAKTVANNFDVLAAIKRIDMARNMVRETESAYSPTLSINGGWTRSQQSGALQDPVGRSSRSSAFSLGASMNWEIDLFGRVRANAKAQKAALNLAKADYNGVMVSLCAKVATAYMQLRACQKQLAVNKAHISSQEKVVKITEARFEAELADMLDVTQARIVLYNTQSTLPGIESKIRTLINTLSILVGEYPGALAADLSVEEPLPGYYIAVNTGVPADILRRRPDIQQAEITLSQYAAQVGIAKKDFLPTLTLAGSIGTEAYKGGDLFGKNSLSYTIAPQLSWTLFDGLARNYRVTEAKLQVEAAIDTYNLTVMNAVGEVDNALQEYHATLQSIDLQQKVVEQSEKSLRLAINLYKTGLTPFSNVVDGQMSWLTSQNELVQLEGEALASLISIYQALGGGWQSNNSAK